MTKNVITYKVYITTTCGFSTEKIAEFTDKDAALQYAYDCIHGENTDDYDWFVDYVEDHNNIADDDERCEFYVDAVEQYDIYNDLQEEWLDNEIIAYIEQN